MMAWDRKLQLEDFRLHFLQKEKEKRDIVCITFWVQKYVLEYNRHGMYHEIIYTLREDTPPYLQKHQVNHILYRVAPLKIRMSGGLLKRDLQIEKIACRILLMFYHTNNKERLENLF